jgi:hypothetical protein
MESYNPTFIHERTTSFPITKKNSYSRDDKCELNQNIFDPLNNSPPNEFMRKLTERMVVYENVRR